MAPQTFVDLNSIPRAAIDSIEILKDSASTIYGADAVAGVVNIKFRHDYRGAETDIEYGNTLDKDSGEFAASLIFGVGDDNTSVYRRYEFLSSQLHLQSRSRLFFEYGRTHHSMRARLIFSFRATRFSQRVFRRPLFQMTDDTFFGHAPFFTNGDAPAIGLHLHAAAVGLLQLQRLFRSAAGFRAVRRFCGMPTTKSAATNWCFMLTFSIKTCKTSYELAPTATGAFQTPGNITLAIPPHAARANPRRPDL